MAPINKYRGDVALPGLGILRYDWERIGKLISMLGPTFDTKIAQAAMHLDLDTIANVLAVGLGDVSAEEIKRQSPPVKTCIDAINTALSLAFNGEGTPPAERAENPPPKKSAISSRKDGKRRSGRG